FCTAGTVSRRNWSIPICCPNPSDLMRPPIETLSAAYNPPIRHKRLPHKKTHGRPVLPNLKAESHLRYNTETHPLRAASEADVRPRFLAANPNHLNATRKYPDIRQPA